MSESQTTVAGSTGRIPDWIDIWIYRMKQKVAAELGVNPDTLQHEFVQVGEEGGQPYIDVRFKSK